MIKITFKTPQTLIIDKGVQECLFIICKRINPSYTMIVNKLCAMIYDNSDKAMCLF